MEIELGTLRCNFLVEKKCSRFSTASSLCGLKPSQNSGVLRRVNINSLRILSAAVEVLGTTSLQDAKEHAARLDDSLSKRHLDLDPAGYFVIYLDEAKCEIVADHYRNLINSAGIACDPDTGKVIPCDGSYKPKPQKTYRGRTAKEISVSIFEKLSFESNVPVTMLNHANYLGREFQKAEVALYSGTKYVQD